MYTAGLAKDLTAMTDPLIYFRAKEATRQHLAAALIEGSKDGKAQIDAVLLRLSIAWTVSGAHWTKPATMPELPTEQSAWLWLWEGCSVDIEDEEDLSPLLDATGMLFEDARRLLRVLKHNRMIYPDGTVVHCLTSLADRIFNTLLAPEVVGV